MAECDRRIQKHNALGAVQRSILPVHMVGKDARDGNSVAGCALNANEKVLMKATKKKKKSVGVRTGVFFFFLSAPIGAPTSQLMHVGSLAVRARAASARADDDGHVFVDSGAVCGVAVAEGAPRGAAPSGGARGPGSPTRALRWRGVRERASLQPSGDLSIFREGGPPSARRGGAGAHPSARPRERASPPSLGALEGLLHPGELRLPLLLGLAPVAELFRIVIHQHEI